MTTVTQWFGPNEKPVNKGVYESTPHGDDLFAKKTKWDGRCWLWADMGTRCLMQDRRWRGLAEKPQP